MWELGPSLTDPMGVVKGLHVSVEELQASIQSIPGQDIALPRSRHMVPQNIGYDVAGHTMMVQHVEKVELVCLLVEEGMADQWVQWVSQGSKVCLMQQAFQELHTSCRHHAGHWCSDSWACLDQMVQCVSQGDKVCLMQQASKSFTQAADSKQVTGGAILGHAWIKWLQCAAHALALVLKLGMDTWCL